MEFESNISKAVDPKELVSQLTQSCDGDYDMGVLFITSNTQEYIQSVIDDIKTKITVKNFLACTCAGVIGTQVEVEDDVGAALFLAKLPSVKFKPFFIDQSRIEQFQSKENYYEFFEMFPNEHPKFLVMADPFQVDLNKFIVGMNEAYGACPIVGGLASGSTTANGNILMVNDTFHTRGIIGLMIAGDVKIDTIVSQGCKPVGENYIVTKAKDNVIYEVAGKPFLQVLKKVFLGLSEKERELAQQALLIGIVMDEYKHKYQRGDFLIRAVLGIDQPTGAIVIGDRIEVGQTIQIHLRDAKTAEEDLNELLKNFSQQEKTKNPQGAFVFCCNGRGINLFGKPNHDIKIIQQHIGPIPAAGFFCAGEFGPIGGKNFLHGFTDSIVVFS